MKVPTPSARPRLWLGAIIILAFGLRMAFLGQDSLWLDKAAPLEASVRPVGVIVAQMESDPHLPL
jgi:hypothetical protein